MAIFQKAYQGYDGTLTSSHHRTLVIFRYALADIFQSRLFAAFFAISFLPSLALLCFVYIYYNIELLTTFEVPVDEMSPIDGAFFAALMQYPQLFLIFVMVMAIGPTMISPDLRNNAMPLYLSRPINKTSYVLGKLLVLLVLGSLISWIPAMILFLVQAYLAADGWLLNNIHLPFAAVVISLCWIISLTLVAFAVSAWVKWKAVARLFFFGLLFLGFILGGVIRELFGGWSGSLFNLPSAVQSMTVTMYDAANAQISLEADMPFGVAVLVLLFVTLVATVALSRRLRAFQVVT